MGIIMMALIPQQSARTRIISQMVVNLSQSLGYKTPSKASTGLFVASFLGQGQLSFLFLTGSTTSLIAWGLLPWDVRAQFTWGYWFLAAFPIAFIVAAIVLISTMFLYRPEPGAEVSYKFVQTQLQLLGPLSRQEWIALWSIVLHGSGLADGFLAWNRCRVDFSDLVLHLNQYRHIELGNITKGYGLGIADLYRCNLVHAGGSHTG